MTPPDATFTDHRNFNAPAHHTWLRLAVMAAVGVIAGLLTGFLGSWAYAPGLGWTAASLTYLIWVWSIIGRLNPSATAAHARREDPERGTADVLILAATVASFGGITLILLDAGNAHGAAKAGIIALALGSIAASWFLVHTLFALRYASLYYRDGAGVDFNETIAPHYRDFAYLAFTLGMTFQVSDTNLTTDSTRSAALRHALLSYLLAAIVLATTINLVSGLVR